MHFMRSRTGNDRSGPVSTGFASLILILLAAALGHAQSVSGTVADENGAAISRAKVRLEVRGRTVAQTSTDERGAFRLDAAQHAGAATLVAEARGFTAFSLMLPALPAEDVQIQMRPEAIREDVSVTVTGTATRLSETPASVVALSRGDLESTAAQTLDDSLRQIAGFTLFRRSSSKTANPTTHGANLRGVSGSGASRAAVLFDDLSLNDAFGGWTFWSRVPKIAVEQAEVLRGGASSFYGTGGLSGAVNIVSPEPGGGPVFRMQASAGTMKTYDGSFIALGDVKGLEFSLAGETFQTAGYIPVGEDDRGLADTRANSRHSSGIFRVGRQFGAPDDALTGRIFLRGNLFAERRDNGTSITYNRTYFRQAAGGFELDHRSAGSFRLRAFIESQVYDQTFGAVAPDRNSETLTRLQRVPSQASGGSIYWSRPIADHTVAASVEIREVRGFSDETGFFGGRATSAAGAGGTEASRAVFVHDLWRVTNRLQLSFGVRYDRWENIDAHSTTRSLASGTTTVIPFPDRSETALSPRIAGLYQFRPGLSVYGSYSRSFRAPTLNELYRGFRVGDTITLANEDLKAETADTFEAGLSIARWRDRFRMRANAFVTTVSDPVVSVTINTTPSLTTRQRQNVGETRTTGLEIDADVALRRDLRLSASYLLADSRVTEFPANPVLIEKFLPQIPKQQLNLQLFYRPAGRFSAGAQARFSGGQFEDDLNTRRLGPYFTMDAAAAYRVHRSVELFAAAENIFNSRYDIGLTPVRTVAAPAFVRLGLRFTLDGQ